MNNRRVVAFLGFVCLAACLLFGCDSPPEVQKAPAEKAELVLLFEHDGVKVYRFWDRGNAIYYTDARGKTEWKTNRMVGRVQVHDRHEVNNEQ